MGVLSWIIVGWAAGWLAGVAMHGSGYGIIGDMILGIIGALISGFLAAAIFGTPNAVTGLHVPTITAAFLGALVCVAVIRAVARPTPV